MLQTALNLTVAQIFSAPFRAVLWKSIGITLALFVGLWFGLEAIVSTFLLPMLGTFFGPVPWLSTALTWLLGAGLILGMGLLVAPVSSVFAGVFLDDIAEAVEGKHYPGDPPGRPLPVQTALIMTLKFLGLVLLANLAALLLVLFFGFGLIVFFLLNGYLLGREYFQFAALRHRSEADMQALRSRHSGTIFFGGIMIALLLAIPVVNLLTPLFAGALMVHIHKGLSL
ncbi:MAG: sulfate transporter family protein [Pseudomonadota bacterium]